MRLRRCPLAKSCHDACSPAGKLYSFQFGVGQLQARCTPHSTKEERWCAAPISGASASGSVVHVVAVASGCCEKVRQGAWNRLVSRLTAAPRRFQGVVKCNGWTSPLDSLDVAPSDAAGSRRNSPLSAVRAAAAACNVTLADQVQLVELYEDYWASHSRDKILVTLLLFGLSLCWVPVGGLLALLGAMTKR